MMSSRSAIQGVIFDLDGTLVHSRLDFDLIRREIGIPKELPILEALDKLPPEQSAAAQAILDRHERQGAESATMIPGAGELLEELRHRGKKLAIVTRNSRQQALATIARLQLPIDLVMSRDDATPKPDPAALNSICRIWRIDPSQVAMIGDYRFDLESGRAARTWTVLYSADCNKVEIDAWQPLTDLRLSSFVDDSERLLQWLESPTAMQ
ncbi:MAG: HAD family hydrolase [Planctomycetota bacterium]|nr:HAD family hydrolase [Planctomycetota bacterium]